MLVDANDQHFTVVQRFTATTLANAQTVAQSIATILGRNLCLACLDQGGESTSAMGSVQHLSGTGGTVTLSGSPSSGTRSIEIQVTAGGTNETMAFTWYLNGPAGAQANNVVASSGSYVLGTTGLTATFGSGTYTTTDYYKCVSTTPVPLPWTAYTAGSQGSTVSSPSGISY
jgi:hypothetical protein